MIKMMLVLFVILTVVSCAAGYITPSGALFESYTMNKDVSSMTDTGTKEGKACVSNILGIFANGDASIKQASENGGIKKVKAVDYSRFSIIGAYIYSNLCTIARGD